jgi:hypothetical protein
MTIPETIITQKTTKNRIVLLAVLVGIGGLIVVVVLAAFFLLIPYRQRINGPEADRRLRTLETEFRSITPLPGASQLRYESSHKTSLGSVSADYDTTSSYAEIRKHYDNQLGKNGWTFLEEKPVKIWWQDYGGKELFYCKDHNAAVIEYAGQWKDAGWTYTFGLSWGLFDECK